MRILPLWAAERLFGYAADDFVGQSLDTLIPTALRATIPSPSASPQQVGRALELAIMADPGALDFPAGLEVLAQVGGSSGLARARHRRPVSDILARGEDPPRMGRYRTTRARMRGMHATQPCRRRGGWGSSSARARAASSGGP